MQMIWLQFCLIYAELKLSNAVFEIVSEVVQLNLKT